MPFSWLVCTPPRRDGADHRAEVAVAELASRAGVLFRLGLSQAEATRRLTAAVAWEYDAGSPRPAYHRPAQLADPEIARIVADTFARRPA